MASAREHVQGEKRSGRGLDGFSVLMVSERRISPQRRGWPESAGKNRESYGSMQSTVLSAAEKSNLENNNNNNTSYLVTWWLLQLVLI